MTPTPFILSLEQRDQFVREAKRLYEEENLPFASFSNLLGSVAPEVWRAVNERRLNPHSLWIRYLRRITDSIRVADQMQ